MVEPTNRVEGEIMNIELTADDLVTENICADLTDYLDDGKWIIEIEHYKFNTGFFGLKTSRCRLFARRIDEEE